MIEVLVRDKDARIQRPEHALATHQFRSKRPCSVGSGFLIRRSG
jgi:hypothetical protein